MLQRRCDYVLVSADENYGRAAALLCSVHIDGIQPKIDERKVLGSQQRRFENFLHIEEDSKNAVRRDEQVEHSVENILTAVIPHLEHNAVVPFIVLQIFKEQFLVEFGWGSAVLDVTRLQRQHG